MDKKEHIVHSIINILQTANFNFTLEELCARIHKILLQHFPLNNFYVAIYNKPGQLLTFPYFVDEVNDKPGNRKFASGLTEFVIRNKETLYLNSAEINKLIEDGFIAPVPREVKNWLGIPLVVRDETAGVIVLKEYNHENVLTEEVKDIMEMASFPISRAIERSIYEEERIAYIKKLHELNESKDKFFSIISHDLKSPFNSILGFTEMLKNQYDELSTEEKKYVVDSLYNSSRNIFNLLNNLLQYSRFEAGLSEFNPKVLSINNVVGNLLLLLEGNALRKKLHITNKTTGQIHVYADEDMLNSILTNLLTNAIKYTNSGGEITISSISNKADAIISIKDNGIGMDEKTLDNLFKLDIKKSTKGTSGEEGTGLGLLLIKSFVEKLGGNINVESKTGEGTMFNVTLPLYKESVE